MTIGLETYLLLTVTGLVAGFVDSIAGGGGLISLPVLLSVGLPPQVALGTNKLQGSFGTLSAVVNYMNKGKTPFRDIRLGVPFTLLGAATGAWAIQRLNPALLNRLIPILLFAVLIYTFFAKTLGYEKREALLPRGLFYLIFGTSLGFYDGFFGPGTGSFWTAALLLCLGLEMTQATGLTKVMNFTSNVVALAVFVLGGHVLYSAGLCMAAGQAFGARIGSNLAIVNGARFIRPFFLSIVFLTLARMLYTTYLA
ncbi:MAG: TSUP family transporter [Desulfosarcinaceae bacterium]